MITKKVKRDNLVTGISEAVICGVLSEMVFLSVIAFTDSWSRLWQSVLVALCLTAVYLVIGCIRALAGNHSFMKKIRKQKAEISLDDDSYEAVSKHVALGSSWLVVHHGNHVEPLSRNNVASVITDGKHAVLYDASHQPVLTFKYGHNEEGVPDRIRQWINVNKSSEYK